MKAIVFKTYGSPDVLQLKEVSKPIPKDREVLIKIHAATVTSGDCRMRAAKTPFGFRLLFRLFFGLTKPKKSILGTEFSGVVESVGENVHSFQQGDEVFVFSGVNCGAYAEYACVDESGVIVKKPSNATHAEAAALSFGGTTALHFLRNHAKIQAGQSVLINGASGGVGTFAVQIAKHLGAVVTGVCSTNNVDLVRSLGAQKVIDYTQEDFTKGHETYDVIFDTVGNLSYANCKKLLKPRGKLLLAVATLPQMLQTLWLPLFTRKKVIAGPAPERKEDLNFLKELVETGNLRVVIDQRYPMEQIAEAHRYVDKGHKKGNVVIAITESYEIRPLCARMA